MTTAQPRQQLDYFYSYSLNQIILESDTVLHSDLTNRPCPQPLKTSTKIILMLNAIPKPVNLATNEIMKRTQDVG